MKGRELILAMLVLLAAALGAAAIIWAAIVLSTGGPACV